MSQTSVIVSRSANAINAIYPVEAVAIIVDSGPTFKVVFETKLEAVVATRTRSRGVSLGIPLDPASARHIEFADIINYFSHYVTQAGSIPNANVVDNGFVAVFGYGHLVVALAEAVPSVVTAAIQSDVGNRIKLLLSRVEVGETDHSTGRAVTAVESYGKVHITVIEIHILVKEVRPGDG